MTLPPARWRILPPDPFVVCVPSVPLAFEQHALKMRLVEKSALDNE
jgi:hypothetical protein